MTYAHPSATRFLITSVFGLQAQHMNSAFLFADVVGQFPPRVISSARRHEVDALVRAPLGLFWWHDAINPSVSSGQSCLQMWPVHWRDVSGRSVAINAGIRRKLEFLRPESTLCAVTAASFTFPTQPSILGLRLANSAAVRASDVSSARHIKACSCLASRYHGGDKAVIAGFRNDSKEQQTATQKRFVMPVCHTASVALRCRLFHPTEQSRACFTSRITGQETEYTNLYRGLGSFSTHSRLAAVGSLYGNQNRRQIQQSQEPWLSVCTATSSERRVRNVRSAVNRQRQEVHSLLLSSTVKGRRTNTLSSPQRNNTKKARQTSWLQVRLISAQAHRITCGRAKVRERTDLYSAHQRVSPL